ncbi:MAG: cell division protein FtsZ [Nitrospina sp.]|jgi:cell division protein FtsZ|nr:cell division protein FtsZ [Nitrospina sp.]
MSLIEFESKNEYSASIKVIGVGGGGTNAVNSMLRGQAMGVEFIVANTDIQSLEASLCEDQIQLGGSLMRGLGAGASPETGQLAAQESEEHIRNMLDGSDMVFITAGMGGGTGTGAAPTIARIARDVGALTVGIVTKPFSFEGKRRMIQAEAGIKELKDAIDTLIVIPNQKLLSFVGKQTSLTNAFGIVDDVLQQAVGSISDLIVTPGLVNLDFADVKTIMGNMGKAIMGSGSAAGENRAIEAAEKAISSPLLDDANIDGARQILINITGGNDMTLAEVDEAATLITANAHEDANIIFGTVNSEKMEGQMRVTVIATGFEVKAEAEKPVNFPSKKKQDSIDSLMPMTVGDGGYRHLKNLANEIKDENPESLDSSTNFDVPTFLRKHAS